MSYATFTCVECVQKTEACSHSDTKVPSTRCGHFFSHSLIRLWIYVFLRAAKTSRTNAFSRLGPNTDLESFLSSKFPISLSCLFQPRIFFSCGRAHWTRDITHVTNYSLTPILLVLATSQTKQFPTFNRSSCNLDSFHNICVTTRTENLRFIFHLLSISFFSLAWLLNNSPLTPHNDLTDILRMNFQTDIISVIVQPWLMSTNVMWHGNRLMRDTFVKMYHGCKK